jgi:transposase-like protein
MTSRAQPDPAFDDQTIELIAERVTEALRNELEAIAASIADSRDPHPLTVEQVAERFGVARSTVYAHWRDWGGYKLGQGEKAAIRFPPTGLPQASPQTPEPSTSSKPDVQRPRRRRERPVLRGAPRIPSELDDGSAIPMQHGRPSDP